MSRKIAVATLSLLLLAAGQGGALATDRHPHGNFTPGAPGIGDPYFPLDGNGGYDVRHYELDLRYEPATDGLSGTATIHARATQNLSRFNLDFQGLHIRSIEVDDRRVRWSRDVGELMITPRHGLPRGSRFTVEIDYSGVPETLEGPSGFIHTDDGALVIGAPDVAALWFPANDHPLDKASFTIGVQVPRGLEAVSNGLLEDKTTRRGWTRWTWNARVPMATYLAMLAIGEFDLRNYRADGLTYWDALDPDLFAQTQPRTGEQFAISQTGDSAYKRLSRTITVPAGGAQLSFWVQRDTEPNWDFLTVEARPAGTQDWTTLPDLNGHATQDTGFACPFWLELHPFLAHYQSDADDDTCAPEGSTGQWWAISGESDGYEQWAVDLTPYAGGDVEVSISYISDDSVQGRGLLVDDIVVSTGEGSTSFENDGDELDGWTVPGPPADSPPNPNDWIVGTAAEGPPSIGAVAEGSFARQPEIIDFLSGIFGDYPFRAAGGIVDDLAELGFALETQTRPIYATGFFRNSESGDRVVVHELAHQWVGDSLAVEAWQHIWLNEGFATYTEWLWGEREGFVTAQQIYDFFSTIPAEDPFWLLTIGDPGPDRLFDGEVYDRGALTLHALRLEVGGEDFFTILRRWAATQRGGNVTTTEFIALAEQVSGESLDELFTAWLFTPSKPTFSSSAQVGDTAAGARGSALLRGLRSWEKSARR